MLERNAQCTLCPLHKTADYVCLLGDERSRKQVLLVGEAPGVQEEKAGRLFIGRAGRLLRQALTRCDFSEEDYSIINSVCCRPPGNRTPKASEIKACRYWVERVFKDVHPRYVLLMGNPALNSVLDLSGITNRRGRPQEIEGIIYLPTFHPSAVLRDPNKTGAFEADLNLFAEIIDGGGVPRETGLNHVVVSNKKIVNEMLDDLHGSVSFDIETTCLYPWDKIAQVNAVGFGTRNKQWILPVNHFCPEASIWSSNQIEGIIKRLTRALDDCVVIAHNGKFDSLWMKVHFGVDWEINFDTMLAHYLLNENSSHKLKYLAQIYLGAVDYDLDPTTAPWDKFVEYHAKDLYYTRKLKYLFARRLNKEGNIKTVFEKILMPCSTLFTEAELNGFYVNVPEMGKVEQELTGQIERLGKKLKKYGDINFNSTQQLAKLLFKELKLKPTRYTDTGAASTDKSVLKRLDHPITKILLEHRSATKLLGTYISGWKPFLVGRIIHPSFLLHGTVTGRTSCEHPNLQQVPRDSSIRSLITAPRGWVFVEADLSQIELRIAAELAGERNMLDTFYNGQDIHWRTALGVIVKGETEYAKKAIQTASMCCMRYKISPNRSSAVLLQKVWEANKRGSGTDKILQLCCKYWQDKATRKGVWREPTREEQPGLERRLSIVAEKEISSELLRELWNYGLSLFTSQKQESERQEKIQFADALSLLSCIGPRIAQELLDDWGEIRYKAKAVGFGFMYGMWHKTFRIYAEDDYGIKISEAEARAIRENFFNIYPALEEWHERQRRYARRWGYVISLSGRKRHLPLAQLPRDCPERRDAERKAINTPVQSFANELNFMAALQIREELRTELALKIVITGLIHDSIHFWIRRKYVSKLVPRILEIMRHPALLDTMNIKLRVPIEAEAKIGPWSKGKELEQWQSSSK